MPAGWRYPKDWIASFGDIVKFSARVFGEIFRGRVFRFFGEALRQAGVLIVGSTIVIWSLCFIIGLQCGIEGAYLNRSIGAPAYAGVFAAWCDLRELVPYAFGYMMAAKIGTGLVAEIGAMRITDEIDALEVMGISSMTFLCATRLLAAFMVLPFMYLAAVGAGFFASYLAVVQQIGEVSLRRVLPDLLDVPEPARPLIQPHKGHGDGDGHRARRLLLRLHGQRRPGGSGNGDGEIDGAQHRGDPPGRDARNAGLLGRQPECANRRLTPSCILVGVRRRGHGRARDDDQTRQHDVPDDQQTRWTASSRTRRPAGRP